MARTRRQLVRELVGSVAGVGLLGPAARITVAATAAGQPPRFFSAEEMALLSHLADLLIPRTATPGALDVNVPGFVDGMMRDWASDESAARFRDHLRQIDASLTAAAGAPFLAAPEAAQVQALTQLDALSLMGQPGGLAGWAELKELLTRAYFATEEGALEELDWRAVPGQWIPCQPLRDGGAA